MPDEPGVFQGLSRKIAVNYWHVPGKTMALELLQIRGFEATSAAISARQQAEISAARSLHPIR
jgi:hypothetical protein